jgi:hypothetical protein
MIDLFTHKHSSGPLRTATIVVEEHHARHQAYSAIGNFDVGSGSNHGSKAVERNGTGRYSAKRPE